MMIFFFKYATAKSSWGTSAPLEATDFQIENSPAARSSTEL